MNNKREQLNCYTTPMLPLWRKVIFIDWHVTMSDAVFWQSVLSDREHRQHALVSEIASTVFGREPALCKQWMIGALSSGEVLQSAIPDVETKNQRALLRLLSRDIRDSQIHDMWHKILDCLAHQCFIVLATDNMDCFASEFPRMGHCNGYFNSLLCSSDLGVLKSENTMRFFNPWLAQHELQFSDALLIDDNPRNCSAFRDCGGVAIQFVDCALLISGISSWLRQQGFDQNAALLDDLC